MTRAFGQALNGVWDNFLLFFYFILAIGKTYMKCNDN